MTVGEKIDMLVKEHIDLYEILRADEEMRDRARNLAMYDPVMRKYVAGKVLERVRDYIEGREAG